MRAAICAAIALWLAACGASHQSALDAAGPRSERIAGLFWGFLAALGLVFAAVMAVALWALTRRHRGFEQEPLEQIHSPSLATEAGLNRRVLEATVATVAILFGLLIASIVTGKPAAEPANRQNSLVVEVTGNQWWWHVRYLDRDPSRIVTTANEIHIPVGRPVLIRGTSHDVIHSFWVPNLNGKRDLIPSRITSEWIQADRPGRFRGQCAEFCGMQHAHMALWVIAEPEQKFQAWVERQLEPAAAPMDEQRRVGQQIFLSHACIFCHTVAGTPAAGQAGPDLTHLAGRSTIAAGTLPNTKGNLGGWILDPQNIKPGTRMATVNLKAEEVEPLLDYLESLQ
ncbi:MAG TPA: cytochrome c oxidase subunit II [Bryobacteraceae bacterium]|jgi:cytochrome c oxidase subunit 2|nr:cytochrome c oxidase subunit II [Bryobacteraceae bacterium]